MTDPSYPRPGRVDEERGQAVRPEESASWGPSPGWRAVRRVLLVLIWLAVLDYLVLPQLAGMREAFHVLGRLRPEWLLTAVALEVASLVCFSLLTQRVLPDHRPRFSWIFRTDLTALGISHVVPGSGAAATTVRCELLHVGGTPVDEALVAVAVESVGSMIVLAVMLWLAIAASIPMGELPAAYLLPAAVASLVLLLAAAGGFRLARRPRRLRLRPWLRSLPEVFERRVMPFAESCGERLRILLDDRDGRLWFLLWAVANWLLDATVLWGFLAAYGWRANPVALMIGYGLANLLGAIPVTPGGLGVIEGVLIPTFVALGCPAAVAVVGVVSWRLLQFWAPIPVAGITYLSLRVEMWRSVRRLVHVT